MLNFRWGMEMAVVERCAGLEHAVDGMQQLAHDGADGLDFLQTPGLDEMVVVGPDLRILADSDLGRPIKGEAQVAIAGLGQARLLVHTGTGPGGPGIESGHGDPLLGAHVLGQDQQLAEELDGIGGSDAGDADE